MVFVTADRNRARLEEFTHLLVTTFPGSTIYQHTNRQHVARDVFDNKVACVFIDAEKDDISGIELVKMLRKCKSNLVIFILSETEDLRDEAMEAGADGYFLYPITQQELKDAILGKE